MSKKAATAPKPDLLPVIFAGVMGLLVAILILKLGNPVILDRLLLQESPKTAMDFYTQSWPPSWAFTLLIPVAILGGLACRFKTNAPAWLIWLPLLWLVWQFLAATQTVDGWLTQVTLKHFTCAIVCFYLGLFAFGTTTDMRPFWWCVLGGILLVLLQGLDQHYGGLEETRRFLTEHNPNWQETLNPEFVKRIKSDRIFGSMVYPNAFAGAILLLLPPMVIFTAQRTLALPQLARGVIVGLLIYTGVACLIWTGSKSGWLIAMVMLGVVFLQMPFPKQVKAAAVSIMLIIGLAGFAYKFANYFKKGAPSVGARFDYWRAAVGTAVKHPVFGSGPGTFSVIYNSVKAPEAEMAQLTHNDYLEQACDSGWPGFLAYTAFIGCFFWVVYRKSDLFEDPIRFAVWLGLLGWALQGFVEFGLYIPALAWPFFLLMGWLTAGIQPARNAIDKKPQQS